MWNFGFWCLLREGFTETTALLVIDFQNDFVRPSFFGVPDAFAALPEVNRLISQARHRSVPVIFTAHLYDQDHPKVKGVTGPKFLIRNTEGGNFVSDLDLRKDDPVFDKEQHSAFSGKNKNTSLLDHLRVGGINDLVLVGLALDLCVAQTAIEAKRLGFGVTVVLSASRGYNNTEETVKVLESHGVKVVKNL